MDETAMAQGLWQQVKAIAEFNGFAHVTRLELLVGSLQGASAEGLARALQSALEGDAFEDCRIEVRAVQPGQSYMPPGRREPAAASGWELLVTRIDGVKGQDE